MPPKKGKEYVLKGASFIGDVKNATRDADKINQSVSAQALHGFFGD